VKHITVRLPDELVARVDRHAKAREWDRSHWIRRALERVADGEEIKTVTAAAVAGSPRVPPR
jgi:predicted transcriptional regulator